MASQRASSHLKFNNLFVKNFPRPDFSEEDLKALFEPFGDIQSCVVFKKDDARATAETGASEAAQFGYGFVCFT